MPSAASSRCPPRAERGDDANAARPGDHRQRLADRAGRRVLDHPFARLHAQSASAIIADIGIAQIGSRSRRSPIGQGAARAAGATKNSVQASATPAIVTRWPIAGAVTPSPSASTIPSASVPPIAGSFGL